MLNSDPMKELAHSVKAVAAALNRAQGTPASDASGRVVVTVPDALMGVTAGLMSIATALDGVAKAISEQKR